MSDYVQPSDLSTLIADFELGSEGAMTTTQANTLIDIIEGELHGVLSSLGVSVPVTSVASPYSYKFIRALAIQGVVGLVQSSIHAISDDTEGSRESAFWRRYEQGIRRMLENGGAALFDATTSEGISERNVTPTMGDQELNVDHYIGLRTLSKIRSSDNYLRASRLYRGFSPARFFDGGPLA